MTGGASEKIRVAIMHLAPDQFLTPILIAASICIAAHFSLVRIADLAGGDSRLHSSFRIEEGVVKTERLEDFAFCQLGQTLARQSF